MNKSVVIVAALILVQSAGAQLRDYRVHKRGMLHQSVFNTGELGRAYDRGQAGSAAGVPSFEWPGNSGVIVDGVAYNGQYHSFGGGIYMAASRADTAARLFNHCGAVEEPVAGRYAFPLQLTKVENLPLLPSGELNPAFNPDEAEEVITAKWATNIGLTVTRVSRSWSLPDYDDLIIYEYEIEHTGDVDGDAGTPPFSTQLTDVLVAFDYLLAPSMFGYERTYNRWDGADFGYRGDLAPQYPAFNRTRWLTYGRDRTGRPEPKYFAEWAPTGKFGGGLLSAAVPGFSVLYYDTTRLAYKTETRVQVSGSDSNIVWDANGHLKQPFLNRQETAVMSLGKVQPYLDMNYPRKNNPYRDSAAFGADWRGRGSYNWRQSNYFGIGHILVFGPYTMNRGDKIRFAIAEVAGYGAARVEETRAGLKDEGGSCGENCGEPTSPATNAFNPVASWYETITYGGADGNGRVHGSDYLSKYPLPQYVNSGVVTVREVADRAIQLYTGGPLVDYDSLQYWPDRMADRGVYQAPITVYAPAIRISNTSNAENEVAWGTQIEGFSAPRLVAPLSHYEVWKSSHPLGPWSRLDSVAKADPRYFSGGIYRLIDRGTRVGESFYYSVLSVDTRGNRSGRTNMTLHQTQLGGTEKLEKVYVVPNPFVVRSGFTGTTATGGDAGSKIGFYNLPKKCTIRVVSYSGQLVETIEHSSELYSTEYLQVTRNNQMIASGVYFYVVETPDGSRTHGKFVVIH